MKQVWKFPILAGANVVVMPKGAEILSVHVQRGSATLWALVSPNEPEHARSILVAGTGWPIERVRRDQFVGTFMLDDGALVFHVFDLGEA